MSVNLGIRDKLPPNSIVLEDESFDNSIIGVSLDDRVIYLFDLMACEYMEDNDCTIEEAWEWLDYNTLRAIPYMPDPKPMVVTGDIYV